MQSTADTITRDAIAATHHSIRGFVRPTPTIEITLAELGADLAAHVAPVVLKLELLQHSGSFKARGAFANLVDRPMKSVKTTGVTAASGGNHGAAVAFAARKLGLPATIFVPEISSPAKQRMIESYGAALKVGGARYADALAACEAFQAATGAVGIHAYNAAETLLGQGTVGLEFEAQAPQLDTLLVAVGGGGLIGGIAAWYRGRISIVGVEPQSSRCLHAALEAGHPVDVDVSGIAADSLGARSAGAMMFPLAQAYVDSVALVSDDAIRDAQMRLWRSLRLIAEPGGRRRLGRADLGRLQAGQGRTRRRARLRRQYGASRFCIVADRACCPKKYATDRHHR